MSTLYCHTNKVNGKKYIGITSYSTSIRWGKNGCAYNCGTFSKAIQKYGWDNFEHEILAEGIRRETAEQLEILLIFMFQTNNPKYGYNLREGGGGKGYAGRKGKQVYIDGKTYPSIAQCEKAYKVTGGRMTEWLHGKEKMPNRFKELGLRFLNE